MPEIVAAIRRAFPDVTAIPAELKSIIDKNDQMQSRQVTREIHTATTQLGKHKKALQEICDARMNHRVAWCKYVTECAEAWKSQLEEFEKQEEKMKEMEQKTKQEIVTCSETIKTLSHSQALEAPQAEEATVAEPAPPVFSEAELKAMQQAATQALQECVSGLAKIKEEPKGTQADIVVSSGDEGTAARAKRQRSTEPPKTS